MDYLKTNTEHIFGGFQCMTKEVDDVFIKSLTLEILVALTKDLLEQCKEHKIFFQGRRFKLVKELTLPHYRLVLKASK